MDEDKKIITENKKIEENKNKQCEDCKCSSEKSCDKLEKGESEEIENLKKALEEEKNAKLRFAADCENLKRMFQREKEELLSFGQTALLMNLLEIIDDLNNVLRNVDEKENAWLSGVKLVFDKLINIINLNGVEVLNIEKGSLFNPQISEAVGSVNVNIKEDENKVVEIVSLGYKRKDSEKIIKAAKVIVSKLEIK